MKKVLIADDNQKLELEESEVELTITGNNSNIYLNGNTNKVLMNSDESSLNFLARKSSAVLHGDKLEFTLFGYGNTISVMGERGHFCLCDNFTNSILNVSNSYIQIFGKSSYITIEGDYNTVEIMNSARKNRVEVRGLRNKVICNGKHNSLVLSGKMSSCNTEAGEDTILLLCENIKPRGVSPTDTIFYYETFYDENSNRLIPNSFKRITKEDIENGNIQFSREL